VITHDNVRRKCELMGWDAVWQVCVCVCVCVCMCVCMCVYVSP